MKDKTHPKYEEATIHCACGEIFKTRSTKPSIQVDICSKCHPFFTGTQKLVDSAGRIEKFSKRYAGKVKPKVKAQAEVKTETKPEAKA